MSLPDGKALIAGSERVAEFFQNTVDENGKLKEGDFIDDVSSVYKLPTFLPLHFRQMGVMSQGTSSNASIKPNHTITLLYMRIIEIIYTF